VARLGERERGDGRHVIRIDRRDLAFATGEVDASPLDGLRPLQRIPCVTRPDPARTCVLCGPVLGRSTSSLWLQRLRRHAMLRCVNQSIRGAPTETFAISALG
jgi:hypothetical protein